MAYHPVCPPVSPVTAPTKVVYEDYFYPQPVQIVHPVQIVRRHHCVPVPYHTVAYNVTDEAAAAVCSHKKSRKRMKK
ncbi:hypothetical protein [Paenibacillus turpanensis]|uniref:hypothetical protein n=1 Tax=Paenibacillus turpanensis TaxID=2689078 RepID=UPI0014078C5D|nr:hypothetical protein [Paenibacillus turpanensis]